MTKVDTIMGFDFYIASGAGDQRTLYNILKQGEKSPKSGYPNRRYIERIQGVRFPDRYQPILHGMKETYVSDKWSGIED